MDNQYVLSVLALLIDTENLAVLSEDLNPLAVKGISSEDCLQLIREHRLLNLISNVPLVQTSSLAKECCNCEYIQFLKIAYQDTFVVILSISNKKQAIDLQQLDLISKSVYQLNALSNARDSELFEEFLVNMNHEIRTPMNGILGFTRILLKKSPSEESKTYLRYIYESAENLLVVFNDLLDYSKLAAGQLTLRKQHFNLILLLKTLQNIFSIRANDKQLKLNLVIDPKLPQILIGDSARIQQIMNHLLTNALKFTEKGEITIKAELINRDPKNTQLALSVTDSGIGIDEIKLTEINTYLKEENRLIAKKKEGRGLGLSIVKKLIDLLDGELKITSTPNHGSKITIWIPLQVGDSKKVSEPLANTQFETQVAQLLVGKKILLAEDNRINQILAEKYFEEVNLSIDTVNTGAEAIQAVQKVSYDLILMDIQMPEIDGIEATIKIKQMEKHAHIPIIALTAHALKEEAEKYKEIGMIDFIPKPFKPEVLYKKILNAMNLNIELIEEIKPVNIPSPTEKPSTTALKLEKLYSYSNGDNSFVIRMLNIFIRDVPNYLLDAKKYLKEKNMVRYKKSLHLLKSSISLVGFDDEVKRIVEIEKTSDVDFDLDQLAEFQQSLEKSCKSTFEQMKLEVEKLKRNIT